MDAHPRDRFITVFGRKPVLEALDLATTGAVHVDKIVLDRHARGDAVDAIVRRADALGLRLVRDSAQAVTRISRHARQDQGVVADVEAPNMGPLSGPAVTGRHGPLFLLDGVTTPSNVGMIIRSVTAAGCAGVVIPRRGCPEIGPLVVKASAGVAFRARLLRAATVDSAVATLQECGRRMVTLCGMKEATPLWTAELTALDVFILGSETKGVSMSSQRASELELAIPMAAGVESLNVAAAAAVVAFELRRRGLTASAE